MSHQRDPEQLRLTIHRDEDGSADLFANATANGFSGHGSAWLNMSEIRDFASRIAQYPLEDQVSLSGGFYSDSGELSQIHLCLRAYLIDGRGQLGMHVTLKQPRYGDERTDSIHCVVLEIRTTYNRMERFSRDIICLLDGRMDEAILEGEVL